eukprot:TRINITY_DN19520_c0_g1_i2.p1 TRINITY_DN19520_c0_g1~~TRINITY_DN19520_c0_g1_i2.p1  ORF type:complete len:345 (-),score=32.39 TRINITY_DN19520_c0_g1_i2:575-1609(-)
MTWMKVRRHCVKACLVSSAAICFFMMSFWLRAKCITSSSRHRHPLRAHHKYDSLCGSRHALIETLEGLCRALLVVSIVELMWDITRAAFKCRFVSFLQETFVRGASYTAVAISCAAVGFTVCVAESNDFNKFDPSSWVAWYCRIADNLCHTFVLSGIIGLVFEILGNTCRSNGTPRCMLIFWSMVFCDDEMERHGVSGVLDLDITHLEVDHPFQGTAEDACPSLPRRKSSVTDLDHPVCSDYVRAAWLWLVFSCAIAAYCLEAAELLPEPLSEVMNQVNIACWATITYVLTDFIHGLIFHENPTQHFHAMHSRHNNFALLAGRRTGGANEWGDASSSSSEEWEV